MACFNASHSSGTGTSPLFHPCSTHAKLQKKSEPPKDKVEIFRLPPYLSKRVTRDSPLSPYHVIILAISHLQRIKEPSRDSSKILKYRIIQTEGLERRGKYTKGTFGTQRDRPSVLRYDQFLCLSLINCSIALIKSAAIDIPSTMSCSDTSKKQL